MRPSLASSTARLQRLVAQRGGVGASAQRRGVLLVPPMLTLDEWEALAVRQQQALVEATRAAIEDDGTTEVR